MQQDKIFSTQFLNASTWAPLTGLSATITIMEVSETDGTTVATPINNVACIEWGNGFYRYYFSAMSSEKVYEYFINPNSASAVISSGWVDKRQNYLDKPLSQIIGTFFTNRSSQYDFGMEDRNNLKKLVKIIEDIEKSDLAKKIDDTNSHIDIAKWEISDKIDSIEIPEAILEEKEAKKAIKIVTSIDKKLTSYIESEMKEKDDITQISSEFIRQEMEDKMKEKADKEEEKRKDEEEKRLEAEQDAKLLEELKAEFDKMEEEDKLEKKKELEKELEETLKEAEEIKKELKTL